MISDPATAHAVHAVFEALGLAAGSQLFFRGRQKAASNSALHGHRFLVLCSCLLGAAIGNKLVFWAEMPHLLREANGWRLLLAGQSMVGGLLGGLLGTEIAKKLVGIRTSTGDAYVMPILLGLAIGRIGCFLAGLNDGTYGIPTSLPWAINFGDGIPRHPTQLYEIAFAGMLALLLHKATPLLAASSGLRFKLMLSAYLAWRLGIDALKPIPFPWPGGLSGIQWICAVALAIYLPLTLRQWRRLHVAQEPSLPVP
ncbi:MAG: prolipoprotein diacylglyceryl transferase [Proteobacteria bacterium]|nr:prolipoprotein diacylglyceryl transferase [Pseudomonadota bacterium]RTL28261.1 MAG: diacylglyceryl transferase [Rhodocyclaceae bacterium]